jgi:hypothetical protein
MKTIDDFICESNEAIDIENMGANRRCQKAVAVEKLVL